MAFIDLFSLLGGNLAIAGVLILGASLAASYLLRSLPKQHVALMVGIVASLAAPLLVVLAWGLGLGRLPENVTWLQQKEWNANQGPSQEPVVSTKTVPAPSVDAAAVLVPATAKTPTADATEIAAEAKPAATSPAVVEVTAAGSRPLKTSDTNATVMSKGWFEKANLLGGNGLLMTWIIGSAALCLLQVRNYFRCQRMLNRCLPVQSAIVQQTLLEAAQRVGIQGEVRLLAACGLPAPDVVGITTPTVLVPEDAEKQFTPSQLYGVLVHELSHIARKDHWMMGFVNGALVLYWWNPLLYLMMRRISETREMICDDIASAASDTADDYAATIVGVAERAVHHAGMIASLGMGESSSTELERRLKRVLSRGNRAAEVCLSPLAKCVTALFVVVLCGAVLVAQVPEPSATQQETKASQAEEKSAEIRVIRGNVTSEDGKGVHDAQVILPLSSVTRKVVEARTDEAGNFELKVPQEWIPKQMGRSQWTVWVYSKQFCIGTASAKAQLHQNSQEPLEVRLPAMEEHHFQVLSPTGEPVSDAVVSPLRYLTNMAYEVPPDALLPHLSARSDVEGRAIVKGLVRKGLLSVRTETTRFGKQDIRTGTDGTRSPTESNPTKEQRIRLRETASIEGRLVGDRTHVGNINIAVTTQREGRYAETTGYAEAQTDAEGRFQIAAIAGGSANAMVYVDDSSPVRPRLPQSLLIEPGRSTVVEITLEQTVKVHGLVRGKKSRKPISNVEVALQTDRLAYSPVSTNEEGKYEANVLTGAINMYLLSEVPGYKTQITLPEKPITVLPNKEGFELPVIELSEAREIQGQLVDKQDKPLANKAINAMIGLQAMGSAFTDKNGKFVMQIPEDSWELVAFMVSDEHSDQRQTSVVQKDPLVLQCSDDLESREVERAKQPNVTLTGKVIFKDKPIAGVAVTLHHHVPISADGSTMRSSSVGTFETDANGVYRLTGLKAGDHYSIEIAPSFPAAPLLWEYPNSHGQIPTNTQGEVVVTDAILLPLQQSLAGTAVDLEGKPLAGVQITAHTQSGRDLLRSLGLSGPQAISDAEGKFRIAELPDIPLRVTAYIPSRSRTVTSVFQVQQKVEKNQQNIRLILDPSLVESEE